MKHMVIGLLTFFAVNAMGQGQITGTVQGIDADGKTEALYAATVFLKGTTTGVTTDVNGSFELTLVDGFDTIIISYLGYSSKELTVSAGDNIKVELIAGKELEGADVITERESTELEFLNPLVSQTISEKELCKAACCNLSESFETNASVDASFTDAVTGTRQIRMLGLDGKYSEILKDNIPAVRGMSTVYGLTYIPGIWIKQIFISKGVGSVTSGYESVTGQINVAIKNPSNSEKFHLNLYGNQGGRMELNSINRFDVTDKWSTTILLHGEWNETRRDQNNDGFLDNPLKKDLIVRNEWKYTGEKGLNGMYQITALSGETVSGQRNFSKDDDLSSLWGAELRTNRIEGSAKTGYVFQSNDEKSIGSQFSFVSHDQNSQFGDANYDSEQLTLRANVLYSAPIFNENHKFTGGLSYNSDEFNEVFDTLTFTRTERTPGAFLEYSWSNLELFTIVAGIRVDENSLYGTLITPRLHVRYSPTENSAFKVVAGKGYRSANLIAENVGILASSRDWIFHGDPSKGGFGFDIEEGSNIGVNFLQRFKLRYRDASISLDYYRTDFQKQIVTDLDQNPGEVHFYQLEGNSYSNSLQAEASWSPVKRLDWRVAYRYLDVRMDYNEEERMLPLVAPHRLFTSVSYETKLKGLGVGDGRAVGRNWKFDGTLQWVGAKRLPITLSNPEEYQLPEHSDDYVTLNAQVTRTFSKKLDVYLGGENLLNFRQPNAILASEDPNGEFFDASMIWGPVFGTMLYGGLRWIIE